MSTKLTVLRTSRDWKQYQQTFAQEHDLSSDLVNWGPGPQEYPCLVASTLADARRVLSCYVYRADANVLLGECAPESPTPPLPDLETLPRLYAVLSVHADLLIDTGIVKLPDYKQRLKKALRAVQQHKATPLLEWLQPKGP